jgi:Dyp-type peroxidase family
MAMKTEEARRLGMRQARGAFMPKKRRANHKPHTSLRLTNIQGNSIGGFSKDFQANLFLQFTNDAAGRAWIKEISSEIAKSSSAAVIEFNKQFSALKSYGVPKPEEVIAAIWVNLALSFQGLTALKLRSRDLKLFPSAFKDGMARAQIGDVGPSDPSKWIEPFNKPDHVHAVLIVAADHSHQLQQRVADITGTPTFKAGVKRFWNQPGSTRADLPGHEHFGFKDGISQPGIRGLDAPDDPMIHPNQGHAGQNLLWPGEFIIGYATQIPKAKAGADGPNPDPGHDSKSGPDWTVDGSYLVFRRLRQDVGAFERTVAALAKRLGWSTDLTGAKLIGRYKSGAPIEQRKFQPGPYSPPVTDPGDANPALGNNKILNNNFAFAHDPDGANCPLAAHIRKAHPRDESTNVGDTDSESHTQTRRLLRRGIPYGSPFVPHDPDSAEEDRGLLFLCYQNDISEHFEFVQNNWVNVPNFPPNPPGPLPPGEDPIIAQSKKGPMLIDPKQPPVSVNHFVTTTGGEYFFSPSISTLRAIGDGSI